MLQEQATPINAKLTLIFISRLVYLTYGLSLPWFGEGSSI
jgi:hypothetical protein